MFPCLAVANLRYGGLGYSELFCNRALSQFTRFKKSPDLYHIRLCEFSITTPASSWHHLWIRSCWVPITPAEPFWMKPTAVSISRSKSFWMDKKSMPYTLGRSSLCGALPEVVDIASWFKMLSSNTRRVVTLVKSAFLCRIQSILDEVTDAMRSKMKVPAIAGGAELAIPVLVLSASPAPAFSLGALAGSLVYLAPKAGDVLLGKWRKGLGLVESLAFCFRLSTGHVFGLLERSLDGLRGVTSTARPCPILTQQLKGFA